MILYNRFTGKYAKKILLWLIGLTPVLFGGCDSDPTMDKNFISDDQITLTEYIENNSRDYSYFYQLLEAENLLIPLRTYGNYTLFLPNNNAVKDFWNKKGYTSFNQFLDDKSLSSEFTRNHILLTSFKVDDFNFGALEDSTVTGEYLTISFGAAGLDEIKVNGYALITEKRDIEASNGVAHVISTAIEPVTKTTLDWITGNSDYSILAEAIDKTGIKNKMSLYNVTEGGTSIRNRFTLFAEADSIFQKEGINSFAELKAKYQTIDDITNERDGLYQFTAYHIMQEFKFLTEMESSNYATFGTEPVSASVGSEIRLNVREREITVIDDEGIEQKVLETWGIPIFYEHSNISTKTGTVHLISEVMEVFTPKAKELIFEPNRLPEFGHIYNKEGNYIFYDPNEISRMHWENTDEESITFIEGRELSSPTAWDWINLSGLFTFEYRTTSIVKGNYDVKLKASFVGEENALIQCYLDNIKIGTMIDLSTTAGTSGKNDFREILLASINFKETSEHVFRIEAIVDGNMDLDLIRFKPVSN